MLVTPRRSNLVIIPMTAVTKTQNVTLTAFQVRAVVSQVFGPLALADDSIGALLASLPANLKAKGFDTESKAITNQFVDVYINLAARLATFAAGNAQARAAVESFAGASCEGLLNLSSTCGKALARAFTDSFAREPVPAGQFDAAMVRYESNRAKYGEAKAYAAFLAGALLSARSVLRFDTLERGKAGDVSAHALASRLSFTLTGALPDAVLRAKAADV